MDELSEQIQALQNLVAQLNQLFEVRNQAVQKLQQASESDSPIDVLMENIQNANKEYNLVRQRTIDMLAATKIKYKQQADIARQKGIELEAGDAELPLPENANEAKNTEIEIWVSEISIGVSVIKNYLEDFENTQQKIQQLLEQVDQDITFLENLGSNSISLPRNLEKVCPCSIRTLHNPVLNYWTELKF